MLCWRRQRNLVTTMRLPALPLFCAAILLLIALPASAQARTDDADYERVGKLMYGVQRLESVAGSGGLGDRIAALTVERDAIVKLAGRVPAARLDAALRELQAINAALAARRTAS